MAYKPTASERIVEDFVDAAYNDGVFGYVNIQSIENVKGRSYTEAECFAALRKMKAEGFIETVNNSGYDWVESGLSLRDTRFTLSHEGRQKMTKHHSYLNYLNHLSKEEKKGSNDSMIKNIGILATLIISLLTLLLTQCPKQKDKVPQKIEEGILSVEKKLDSLLQVLPQSQPDTPKRLIVDTATSK